MVSLEFRKITTLFEDDFFTTIHYEWDNKKAEINLDKHHISFELIQMFEWDTSIFAIDSRNEYNEIRYQCLGFINLRLHMLIFTQRENIIRVISLRKANKMEIKIYANTI